MIKQQAEAIVDKAQMYLQVFGTPAGQKVLSDILAHCQVFDCNASTDSETAAKRNVGLYILHNSMMLRHSELAMVQAAIDKAKAVKPESLISELQKLGEV